MLPRNYTRFTKERLNTSYITHANLFSTISSFSGVSSDLHPEFVFNVLSPNGNYDLSPPHHHDYFQVIHASGPSSFHTIGNKTFTQQNGEIAIIPPGKKHNIFITENGVSGGYHSYFTLLHALSRPENTRWKMIVDWAYLRPWISEDEKSLILSLPKDKHSRLCEISIEIAALEKILIPHTKNPKSPIVTEFFDSLLKLSDEYISYIAECFYADCSLKELKAFNKYRKPVIDTLSYIEDNLATRITLEDICEISGLKTSRISQIFREAIGMAINDYVNFCRCRKARILLVNSSLSIGKIGEICGFNSTIYFDRVFKLFTGCTPKIFRDDMEIEWQE